MGPRTVPAPHPPTPMPNYNSITLVGHATRDAELRFIPSGTAVAAFGIAVNKKRGEKEEVHFFDVSCWGSTAEAVATQVRKGSGVIVVGDLKTEKWKDKTTGADRSKVVVNAMCVGMALYEKKGLTPQTKPSTTSESSATSTPSDDVPF